MPLLDIVATGPDQLAAKSAALAISALASNHTANQDAIRSSHWIIKELNPCVMRNSSLC